MIFKMFKMIFQEDLWIAMAKNDFLTQIFIPRQFTEKADIYKPKTRLF